MIAGMVVSSVLAGLASLLMSVLAGHPPIYWLFAYCLAGFCAFLLALVVNAPALRQDT